MRGGDRVDDHPATPGPRHRRHGIREGGASAGRHVRLRISKQFPRPEGQSPRTGLGEALASCPFPARGPVALPGQGSSLLRPVSALVSSGAANEPVSGSECTRILRDPAGPGLVPGGMQCFCRRWDTGVAVSLILQEAQAAGAAGSQQTTGCRGTRGPKPGGSEPGSPSRSPNQKTALPRGHHQKGLWVSFSGPEGERWEDAELLADVGGRASGSWDGLGSRSPQSPRKDPARPPPTLGLLTSGTRR